MCDLKRKSRRKEITGWKVVAVHDKTGEYYSSAMGFKYPKRGGKIPKVKRQNRLSASWIANILYGITFRDDMIGRTVIFLSKGGAISLKMGTSDCHSHSHKIIRAVVSDDIMTGTYGTPEHRIAAGRRIRFLE